METNEKTFKGFKISGFRALSIMVLLLVIAAFMLMVVTPPGILTVIICALLVIYMYFGFIVIEPNNSRVLTFFGKYVGTIKENGFFWINPFFTKTIVTLRFHNLDIEPIKVNDKVGNPVMIGAVLVWRVKDTYKAVFDISQNIKVFIHTQSDAALRQVAGAYAYDTNEANDKVTLRSDNGEVAKHLENELSSRLEIAGIEVIEARINYLAYASEIASVMLRRQQADAIISARERIVEGAVSMVHLALEKLDKEGVVNLDEDKKAAMVSNLLVVLCADESAQPVINTGTLYH